MSLSSEELIAALERLADEWDREPNATLIGRGPDVRVNTHAVALRTLIAKAKGEQQEVSTKCSIDERDLPSADDLKAALAENKRLEAENARLRKALQEAQKGLRSVERYASFDGRAYAHFLPEIRDTIASIDALEDK